VGREARRNAERRQRRQGGPVADVGIVASVNEALHRAFNAQLAEQAAGHVGPIMTVSPADFAMLVEAGLVNEFRFVVEQGGALAGETFLARRRPRPEKVVLDEFEWTRGGDEEPRAIRQITDTTTGDELRSLLDREPEACARVAFAALARARAGAVSPLERLGAVTVTSDALEVFRRRLVVQALAAGATWAEIGRGLGVTRQAAHQRYGREA
jgi:hypothetical protein